MKTALVTGGGRGIGRAIALRLVKAGFRVAITARTSEQLDETVALSKGAITSVTADMADPEAIRAMIAQVEQRLGSIDLLVNNAGWGGTFEPIWESDPQQWWRCLEVNLRGPYECSRAVLPAMIARHQGCIINIASGAGGHAIENMSAYVASKTALIRLTEQIAVEAKPYGVSAFAIRPGVVRTAMVEEARQKIPMIQNALNKGLESPPEAAADLVAYLATGKASRLSGRLFDVVHDPQEMVDRAAEIEKENQYLLRLKL